MPNPPNYLQQLSQKIEKKKLPEHKFIVIGTGMVHKINKEVLQSIPLPSRQEANRSLINDWQEGKQKLNNLVGIVKDIALLYKSGTAEDIFKQIKNEIDFMVKVIIVPINTKNKIKEILPNYRVIGLEECLFLE